MTSDYLESDDSVRDGLRVTADGFDEVISPDRRVVFGRDPTCDVWLGTAGVSRRHAELSFDAADGWALEDLESRHGTFHEGVRVRHLRVTSTATVHFGGPGGAAVTLRRVGRNRLCEPPLAVHARRSVSRIGRGPENDIVVPDLLVSRRHAELLETDDGAFEVVDLHSHNGTFVNGRRVSRAHLSEHDVVGVGRHSFMFATGGLVQYVEPAEATLEVRGLTVRLADGKVLVDDLSFALRSQMFLAIAGPAGAGKSTLAKAVTGFRWPDGGTVLYNGRDFYESLDELRSRVGYVPQDDVLHDGLTLRQALDFGAELRLPPDMSREERLDRVDRVMAELGLTEHGETAVRNLSGGQKKRANVAVELLTDPSVLLLDEPTSGLDQGYVKVVMEHLKQVAERGRIVIVVTHLVERLDLCDLLLMLAPGGRIAFLGRPAEMLAYFGRAEHADVFQDLENDRVRDWAGEFARRSVGDRDRTRTQTAPARLPDNHARTQPTRAQVVAQFSTLVRRQLALVRAGRQNLAVLAAVPIVFGLAIAGLTDSGALNLAKTAPHPDARFLLAAIVIVAATIAAANTTREIVKERRIFQHERTRGVIPASYLASKVAVFGVITLVQVVLLVLLATIRAGGPGRANLPLPPLIELMIAVTLVAWASMALGLFVSAIVPTSDTAMALVVVIFIVGWLFSGAAIDLQDKPPMRVVGYATSSNWGLAASASTSNLLDLERRCVPGQIDIRLCDPRWATGSRHWLLSIAALAVLTVAALLASWLAIEFRDVARRPSHRP